VKTFHFSVETIKYWIMVFGINKSLRIFGWAVEVKDESLFMK
jgi:hypothetical protein